MLRTSSIALLLAAPLHSQLPAGLEPPALPPEAPPIPAPEAAPAPQLEEPSTNVTVNLISRLVQKGILTQEEAAVLIQQAQNDAAQAEARAAAAAAAVPQPLDPITGAPAGQETRVTYIPDNVRNDMRDQIRQEIMAQAREENWGTQQIPDWTRKFRFFGDFRGRYEEINFGNTNDTGGHFVDFHAINRGSPYDSENPLGVLPPLYNVDKDRERARVRARIGTELHLEDGFSGGLRIATGENNSPISPNQTLGGGNGNFSKYAIWLDRAFLAYDAGPLNGDGEELTFLIGRFDSPFFSTEIQWDDDIGFDGLALRGRVNLNDRVSTFFSGGLFPIYNTDFHFASNNTEKFDSNDRWLYGAQIGIDWKIDSDWKLKAGLSYYDFKNVEGKLSSPFLPFSPTDAGNTDHRRTLFGQRGNTMMPLRNIPTYYIDPDNNTLSPQYQYYGLASEFRNLTLTGKLDYDGYEEIKFSLIGEITKNLGFDRSKVAERAYSDGRPGRTLGEKGDFKGGDIAWNLALQIGHPELDKRGDWLATIGYRYVESDAVIDGFTDSDFGGGGTNLKGFTLGATFALSPSVRAGIRWMSADEIDGPPLSTDTLQFDLNARF